jgi:hypothetical protein
MRTVAGQGSGQPAEAGDRDDRDERGELIVAVGAYVLLFVLGILQGLIGTFQYSRALGSVPVGAVAFAVLIGVTCVLGAWGMHRPLGGLLPGVGWLLTSLILARGTAGGSVLITNTAAGQWFLFGGAVCAAAGVVTGFVRWSPAKHRQALPRGRWPG